MSTESIVDRLRRSVKPHRIGAVDATGKETPIALGTGKGRWQRVTHALDSLPWVQLRCYDVDGALKDSIPRDDDEPDDLPLEKPTAANGLTAQLELMLRAQDHQLERLRHVFEPMFNGASAMIGASAQLLNAAEARILATESRLAEAEDLLDEARPEGDADDLAKQVLGRVLGGGEGNPGEAWGELGKAIH